jgi:hypothetical protein
VSQSGPQSQGRACTPCSSLTTPGARNVAEEVKAKYAKRIECPDWRASGRRCLRGRRAEMAKAKFDRTVSHCNGRHDRSRGTARRR